MIGTQLRSAVRLNAGAVLESIDGCPQSPNDLNHRATVWFPSAMNSCRELSSQAPPQTLTTSAPRPSRSGVRRRLQTALGLDEIDNAIQPFTFLQAGHDERPLAAHPFRIRLHLLQRSPDVRRKVNLVDDKEIGAGDAGTALGGDLVAGRDVYDIDGEVGELRGEGGCEIVTAGLDQH